MNEDYEFEMSLLKGAYAAKQIDDLNYRRIHDMLTGADGEDLDQLLIINDELIRALEEFRIQNISERLVKGAEMIEAEQDPSERKRLIYHYDNLLKELA